MLQRRPDELESMFTYTVPRCGVLQPATEELEPLLWRVATHDEKCYHGHKAGEHDPTMLEPVIHFAGSSKKNCWNRRSFPTLQWGLGEQNCYNRRSGLLEPNNIFAGTFFLFEL